MESFLFKSCFTAFFIATCYSLMGMNLFICSTVDVYVESIKVFYYVKFQVYAKVERMVQWTPPNPSPPPHLLPSPIAF